MACSDTSWRPSADLKRRIGGFNFAQCLLPLMLANDAKTKGTLIFTGATMSLRSGANFSAMAPAMFARRALAQSLAREFGPQGIHVGHVIIDGMIDTPRARERLGEDKAEKVSIGHDNLEGKLSTRLQRLNPEEIAEVGIIACGFWRRMLNNLVDVSLPHCPTEVSLDTRARYTVCQAITNRLLTNRKAIQRAVLMISREYGSRNAMNVGHRKLYTSTRMYLYQEGSRSQ